jgi:DNA-binding IclR family transcriptional regulator
LYGIKTLSRSTCGNRTARGYAIAHGEIDEGLIGLATPVTAPNLGWWPA